MSHNLFDTAPDFNQPIAVLKHCHDRIRKQLETLQKLLAHLPVHGADSDARRPPRPCRSISTTLPPCTTKTKKKT